MMGRKGSSSTIGAMHFASGLMSFAVGKAIQDGIGRANDLAAEDQALARGRARYAARVRQRRAEMLDKAESDMVCLLAERKRLHG